jgi:hypothetical protein
MMCFEERVALDEGRIHISSNLKVLFRLSRYILALFS